MNPGGNKRCAGYLQPTDRKWNLRLHILPGNPCILRWLSGSQMQAKTSVTKQATRRQSNRAEETCCTLYRLQEWR